MDAPLTKSSAKKLLDNTAEGQVRVDLEELKVIAQSANQGSALAVKYGDLTYVVFEIQPLLQFAVHSSRVNDLAFIEGLKYVDADSRKVGFTRFLLNEFMQGASLFQRMKRLSESLIMLALLNFTLAYWGTQGSAQNFFIGVLTAISVFIAVFSIFVANHDYMKHKTLIQFETGKLGYYFSIDRHMTKTGVTGIIAASLGVIITSNNAAKIGYWLSLENIQNILIIALMNVAFMTVFIVLRSLSEFYITRPGKFILGKVKDDYLKSYFDKKNEDL